MMCVYIFQSDCGGGGLYGHFGPWALRHQDISALVPKCPKDTSEPVPTAEMSGQFGTKTDWH